MVGHCRMTSSCPSNHHFLGCCIEPHTSSADEVKPPGGLLPNPHVRLTGMARVLFTSCPQYGHVLPMLPLIRAAGRAGHDVRVATGPDLRGPLADSRARRPRGRADLRGVVVGPRGRVGGPGPVRGAEDDGRGRGAVRHAGARPAHRPRRDGRGVAARRRRPRGAGVRRTSAGRQARGARDRARHRPDVPLLRPPHRPCGRRDRRARAVGDGLGRAGPGHLSTFAATDDGPPPWPTATPAAAECRRAGPGADRVAEVLAADDPSRTSPWARSRTPRPATSRSGSRPWTAYDGVVIATTGRRLGPDELGPVPPNVVVEGVRPPGRRARARRPAGLPQRVGHHARRAGPRRTSGRSAARDRPAPERRPARARRRRAWSCPGGGTPSTRSSRDRGR